MSAPVLPFRPALAPSCFNKCIWQSRLIRGVLQTAGLRNIARVWRTKQRCRRQRSWRALNWTSRTVTVFQVIVGAVWRQLSRRRNRRTFCRCLVRPARTFLIAEKLLRRRRRHCFKCLHSRVRRSLNTSSERLSETVNFIGKVTNKKATVTHQQLLSVICAVFMSCHIKNITRNLNCPQS